MLVLIVIKIPNYLGVLFSIKHIFISSRMRLLAVKASFMVSSQVARNVVTSSSSYNTHILNNAPNVGNLIVPSCSLYNSLSFVQNLVPMVSLRIISTCLLSMYSRISKCAILSQPFHVFHSSDVSSIIGSFHVPFKLGGALQYPKPILSLTSKCFLESHLTYLSHIAC